MDDFFENYNFFHAKMQRKIRRKRLAQINKVNIFQTGFPGFYLCEPGDLCNEFRER